MAASVTVSTRVELDGLGKNLYMQDVATDGTTPSESGYFYKVLGTANTAEALDLGGVSTVSVLHIRAINYDLDIDLDYVSAFDADLTVKAGEPAAVILNPAGTVYVKNNQTDEQPSYEYLVMGT